ncbi:MAG: hypothetical protein ACSLE5_12275 [Porticoccaceae bacterium]
MSTTRLALTRPDDWHLHLRDGDLLASVLPDTARRFARAIIMPNLKPPATTTEQACAYRDRILAALPAGMPFEPLMTRYLTETTSPKEIAHAAIELYAELFEQAGALDKLEAFASFHGPDFYDLPRNRDTLTLEKRDSTVPGEVRFGKETGVPLRAGATVAWRLEK